MFVFGVHHWHQRVEFLVENFCSRVLFAGTQRMLLEAPDFECARTAAFVLVEDGFLPQIDCTKAGYTVSVQP